MDVKTIIDRVKEQCNLIWLENLNLRGSYKTVIMNYIRENILSFCRCIKKFIIRKNIFTGSRWIWS